jgi:hypothetical protein
MDGFETDIAIGIARRLAVPLGIVLLGILVAFFFGIKSPVVLALIAAGVYYAARTPQDP